MQPTVYQKPEIRDANDNIIQQGAFGKNTALANATNDGWIDYVANDLEFLYDLAKDEVVPVPSLPASGQLNKTYLLTTTGVSYRWSGTEWVAVSSSEAVGRAESAANLAEQWATKTDGSVDGTEYSAKYYAQQAEQSADDAQDVADDMAEHLVQIDKNTGGVAKNSKRIGNIEKLLQGNLYDYDTDDDTAYTKTVPAGALPYAGIEQIGGKTVVWNQLVDSGTTTVSTISGHKYYTLIDGTASIVTADGTAITIVDDTADMVSDLTLMFGAGNEPSTVAEFEAMFPADYYPYNAGTLLSAGVTEVKIKGANLLGSEAFEIGNISTSYGTNTSGANFMRTVNKIAVKGGSEYICSVQGVQFYGVYRYSSGTYLGYSRIDSKTYTGTFADNVTHVRFVFVPLSGETADIANIKNPSMIKSDTIQSYPIPAEVKALEGYGWSAGTAYNYIDFERKVFVKHVDRVVLDGTQALANVNWRPQTNTVGWGYSLTLTPNIKRPSSNTDLANVVANSVETKTYYDLYNTDVIGIGVIQQSNTSGLFVRGNSTLTTATTINAYLSANPITVYYELATPIETDISQYLTDNLIEVGAGGTLTFPNSNGNDYHIPVPSTETYMIDLQEAIENGN